jgi:hypothetical protein
MSGVTNGRSPAVFRRVIRDEMAQEPDLATCLIACCCRACATATSNHSHSYFTVITTVSMVFCTGLLGRGRRLRIWPRRCSCASTASRFARQREHNVGAWLYRTATNMGYNELRSRSRRWRRDTVLLPDPTDASL